MRRAHASLALLLLCACKGERENVSAEPSIDAGADAGADAAADAGVDAAAPPAPPEQVVFRLGDNLLTAHRLVDGDLVVDAGSIAFARYTRFGQGQRWRLGREVDGRRVAVARKGGRFELPLSAEQAEAARGLALRLTASEDDELRVAIGGDVVGTIEVAPGRAWYRIAIPPGRFVAGENVVAIDRGEVALDAVRVYADPASTDEDDPFAHASWAAGARELALDEGSGLAWYVQLPAGARVVGEVAAPCRVEIDARADDGTRAGGVLDGASRSVDLAAVGERPVRLELVARGCPRAVLADPAIAIGAGAPGAAPEGPRPELVILWVMDALRAESVPTFTPGARADVPALDALARDGAVFRQYYVVGNESQTSHSTVWTGTYPAVHNVRTAGEGGTSRIPRHLPVVAELIKQAGYRTVGVTGNGFVTASGGYARGFDEFRNMMREKGRVNGVLYGEAIVDHALRRLAARRREPTFLFLGTIDTHGPWIARRPWIDRYDHPKPYTGPFQEFGTAKELGIRAGVMGCSKIPPVRDIARLRAIYDSAISYQDARLGELVARLKRLDLYDKTMIIVTADHGEELFEDGRCGHGASLRETLVRVPLLVHYPARVAPAIIDEGVDGVDVLPTILDALDGEIPRHVQGESLLPLAAGVGRGWPRPSYASQYEYAHAMRIARWKIRVGRRGSPRVFDLVDDPGEHRNVARARPIARRMLTDALGLFLATRARWHKRTMGVVTNLAAGASERLEGGR